MAADITGPFPHQHHILCDTVREYPGLLPSAEALQRELLRTPRRWHAVLDDLKSYALKNFQLHDSHPQGLDAMRDIVGIFFEAIEHPIRRYGGRVSMHSCFTSRKLLLDGRRPMQDYWPLLMHSFSRIAQLDTPRFLATATNTHPLKRMGQRIAGAIPEGCSIDGLNDLLERTFRETYTLWLSEEDPSLWFDDVAAFAPHLRTLKELLQPVSHDNLRALLEHLASAQSAAGSTGVGRLRDLLALPGHLQIVTYYEESAGRLPSESDGALKIAYLFKVMESQNLSGIHEEAVREIGRTVAAS